MNNVDGSILLMLNDDGVAELYDDSYDVVIHCTSEEDQKRAKAMLENCMRWTLINEDDPNSFPENEGYILLSFENFTLPQIGHFERDEDGGGAFFLGDEDVSVSNCGLFVNAWMKLPKCYET